LVTRIYLTGRLAIEHDGRVRVEERDLPGRQGRLGFAYLVAHRHRPVLREALADVLWPDGDAPDGDATFSAVLSRLRSLMRKAGLADAAITVDHGAVSLRLPKGAWVDIEAAANAIDLCDGALRRGDRVTAWGHANVAIVIAKRPFLQGAEAPWIETWRQKLQAIVVRALHGLVTVSALNGEPAVAIQHAEEILALEPYRETAYQELMRLHAAMGNRAEALRVFARCRDLLQADLQTTPSPQTLAAWRAIESGSERL
jgi:DNA-binding SARP family transcriptional activator